MSLVPCEDCGAEISTAAPSCPHCGRPAVVESKRPGALPKILGSFLLVVGGVASFGAYKYGSMGVALMFGLGVTLLGLMLFVAGRFLD